MARVFSAMVGMTSADDRIFQEAGRCYKSAIPPPLFEKINDVVNSQFASSSSLVGLLQLHKKSVETILT